jgi:hypothetical protein
VGFNFRTRGVNQTEHGAERSIETKSVFFIKSICGKITVKALLFCLFNYLLAMMGCRSIIHDDHAFLMLADHGIRPSHIVALFFSMLLTVILIVESNKHSPPCILIGFSHHGHKETSALGYIFFCGNCNTLTEFSIVFFYLPWQISKQDTPP